MGRRMVEAEKSRTRRIFKHDVAITSDQKGIFHSAPFIRRNREGGTRNPHSSLSTLHPSCYGLLTGNLPRLLLTVLSLHSLGLSFFLLSLPFDFHLALSLLLSPVFESSGFLRPSRPCISPHFHPATFSSNLVRALFALLCPFSSFTSAVSFGTKSEVR